MLREWLGSVPVDDFAAMHLGRAPHAAPGAAAGAIPFFQWADLDRILPGVPASEILVVARGHNLDLPVPRSLRDVRALMRLGVGVVIRRAQRSDARIAEVTSAFARDLPRAVHAQLFVTPGGTHGFGWHYDFEDVFIAQTAGMKDYYFRANTVCPDVEPGPAFHRYPEERSPLHTARLVAGDWLYIPSGWWHMARCVEDSLSISVGVELASVP